MSVAKVPCTIVTGFLGAGKTTLVRHLLGHAGGKRIALIVNEFGDVGVDGEILDGCGDRELPRGGHRSSSPTAASAAPSPTISSRRCRALLDRPRPPDHIVIETSGLALPQAAGQGLQLARDRTRASRSTASSPWSTAPRSRPAASPTIRKRSPGSAPRIALDHDNPLEEVFEDQLLCADLVVMNKADLMSSEQRRSVVDEIGKTLSRAVKVVETENGKVSLKVLLGLGAEAEADLASRPSHHDLEGEHDHEDFDTFIVELPVFESPQHLVERLVKAAETHDILRMKGFVDIAGKPMRLLVQGVGARVQHQYDRKWPGERRGRLVVIGEKGFDRDAISELIRG